jgi:hypothetical protein
MSKILARKEYMTKTQKDAMGNLARDHYTCIEKTKVARPGKTAQDKARKHGGKVD